QTFVERVLHVWSPYIAPGLPEVTNQPPASRGLYDPRLQWSANAAVLAHAPEMDGDEDGDGQRNGDAVQHVKAQQRLAADKASAQQDEARIGAGMDERDIPHFQERGSRPLVAKERRGAGHVTADCDGPDG